MPPKKQQTKDSDSLRDLFIRSLPALLVLCVVLVMFGPNLQNVVQHYINVGGYVDERRIEVSGDAIADLFTPEVDYWRDDIARWAQLYGVDPNLVATIIQIESCGDPDALSVAGAQGLMQVMPQHFSNDENPLDPDTNAQRGLGVLTECLYSTYNPERDVGLAFACYNGGPSVFVRAWNAWPQQSRDYYIWGTNIYSDAQNNFTSSETLDQWLLAGGESLCVAARQDLGLATAAP
jgi:soluble lytic murein transglycosylase-like protein